MGRRAPNTVSAMSQAHADRNLLFGILALQMDFIRRDDLIAARRRGRVGLRGEGGWASDASVSRFVYNRSTHCRDAHRP